MPFLRVVFKDIYIYQQKVMFEHNFQQSNLYFGDWVGEREITMDKKVN